MPRRVSSGHASRTWSGRGGFLVDWISTKKMSFRGDEKEGRALRFPCSWICPSRPVPGVPSFSEGTGGEGAPESGPGFYLRGGLNFNEKKFEI